MMNTKFHIRDRSVPLVILYVILKKNFFSYHTYLKSYNDVVLTTFLGSDSWSFC